jgi:hypothetical protein
MLKNSIISKICLNNLWGNLGIKENFQINKYIKYIAYFVKKLY